MTLAGAVTGGTFVVEYTYDLTASGGVFTKGARPDTVVYPSGRVVEYAYGAADDHLGRVTSVGTDDDLTSYAYLGLGTFVETLYSSEGDTVAKLIYTGGGSGDAKYPGLDRFNRVVDHRWIDDSDEDLDRFQYGYDANSNRLWRRNVTAAALDKPFDELYAYDRVNRLVDFQRGTLSAGRTAIVGTPAKQQDWTLDATGNWSHFTSADEGALETDQTRLHNGANEITVLSSWYPPSYDHAGNMTRLPKPATPSEGFAATYDAWNRLVALSEVTCDCPGDLVAEYQYDAQTWRTLALNYVDGELDETRHYFYSASWQILEERLNALTSPERQHVWGLRYIDDLSRRYRDTDSDGDLDETLWALQDANWNATSLASTSGTVLERYAYDAYGIQRYLSPDWAVRDASLYDTTVGYAGQLREPTFLNLQRFRFYHGVIGAWVSRDPLANPRDLNRFAYCAASPLTNLDPLGLMRQHHWFPQASELLKLFNDKCGDELKWFGLSARQFIDLFTSEVPGGGEAGSAHHFIHHGLRGNWYLDAARDIYKSSQDCCTLLTRMGKLIIDTANKVLSSVPNTYVGAFGVYHKSPLARIFLARDLTNLFEDIVRDFCTLPRALCGQWLLMSDSMRISYCQGMMLSCDARDRCLGFSLYLSTLSGMQAREAAKLQHIADMLKTALLIGAAAYVLPMAGAAAAPIVIEGGTVVITSAGGALGAGGAALGGWGSKVIESIADSPSFEPAFGL